MLDCSEELLSVLHELLGMIESTKAQDPEVMESLSKRIFFSSNKILVPFLNCPHLFTEPWLTPPSLPDIIKTEVSQLESCQKRLRRRSMLRLRRTLQVLAFVVHTKSKIWVVSAEIGLLETLSRWSMLNKCECRIAMILWRVLPLLIFNN